MSTELTESELQAAYKKATDINMTFDRSDKRAQLNNAMDQAVFDELDPTKVGGKIARKSKVKSRSRSRSKSRSKPRSKSKSKSKR